MFGQSMTSKRIILAAVALTGLTTGCHSHRQTWEFELGAGETWKQPLRQGDVAIHNEGPASIDVAMYPKGDRESILAPAMLASGLTAGGDATMEGVGMQRIEIRNDSDTKTRVRVTVEQD